MTRFEKNAGSSVCNATKKAYSIIDSKIIIHISGERAWHNLQKNEAIYSTTSFSNILDRIFEKLGFA